MLSRNFLTDLDLLKRGVRQKSARRLSLEFSVSSARAINHIASITEEAVYDFDVFTGLPESWRTGFEAGKFVAPLALGAA